MPREDWLDSFMLLNRQLTGSSGSLRRHSGEYWGMEYSLFVFAEFRQVLLTMRTLESTWKVYSSQLIYSPTSIRIVYLILEKGKMVLGYLNLTSIFVVMMGHLTRVCRHFVHSSFLADYRLDAPNPVVVLYSSTSRSVPWTTRIFNPSFVAWTVPFSRFIWHIIFLYHHWCPLLMVSSHGFTRLCTASVDLGGDTCFFYFFFFNNVFWSWERPFVECLFIILFI